MVTDKRPPNISRGSGDVTDLRLSQTIKRPIAEAATIDSEMLKSFVETPGMIRFKVRVRLTQPKP